MYVGSKGSGSSMFSEANKVCCFERNFRIAQYIRIESLFPYFGNSFRKRLYRDSASARGESISMDGFGSISCRGSIGFSSYVFSYYIQSTKRINASVGFVAGPRRFFALYVECAGKPIRRQTKLQYVSTQEESWSSIKWTRLRNPVWMELGIPGCLM